MVENAEDAGADMPREIAEQMSGSALRASQLLKSLAHPGRLMILCRLAESGATVSEIEDKLGLPQAVVSKQLARLREEGLVEASRDGRAVAYTLADENVRSVIATLYDIYCE